ncbi:unnamed protein product, partial [Closterium sp. NIES-54]
FLTRPPTANSPHSLSQTLVSPSPNPPASADPARARGRLDKTRMFVVGAGLFSGLTVALYPLSVIKTRLQVSPLPLSAAHAAPASAPPSSSAAASASPGAGAPAAPARPAAQAAAKAGLAGASGVAGSGGTGASRAVEGGGAEARVSGNGAAAAAGTARTGGDTRVTTGAAAVTPVTRVTPGTTGTAVSGATAAAGGAAGGAASAGGAARAAAGGRGPSSVSLAVGMARHIARTEGVRGFFRGMGTVVAGMLPGRIIYMAVLEAVKANTLKGINGVTDQPVEGTSDDAVSTSSGSGGSSSSSSSTSNGSSRGSGGSSGSTESGSGGVVGGTGRWLHLSDTAAAGLASAVGGMCASLATQAVVVPVDVVSGGGGGGSGGQGGWGVMVWDEGLVSRGVGDWGRREGKGREGGGLPCSSFIQPPAVFPSHNSILFPISSVPLPHSPLVPTRPTLTRAVLPFPTRSSHSPIIRSALVSWHSRATCRTTPPDPHPQHQDRRSQLPHQQRQQEEQDQERQRQEEGQGRGQCATVLEVRPHVKGGTVGRVRSQSSQGKRCSGGEVRSLGRHCCVACSFPWAVLFSSPSPSLPLPPGGAAAAPPLALVVGVQVGGGMCAGLASALATTPLDTVKTRIQVKGEWSAVVAVKVAAGVGQPVDHREPTQQSPLPTPPPPCTLLMWQVGRRSGAAVTVAAVVRQLVGQD